MPRKIINTDHAPSAIGPYVQAVQVNDTVYLSGQIPLDPSTGELVTGDIDVQTRRVFDNLDAICAAAGGSLGQLVRLGIYMTDLSHFDTVNRLMEQRFTAPYPSRATVQVAALPKGAHIEMDAIMVLD